MSRGKRTAQKISEEKAKGNDSPSDLTSRSGRLKFSDIRLMVELHDKGMTQVQIAETLKCSQATVSNNLAALQHTPELVAKLMQADSYSVLTDWKRARKVAAKRGDHRPAREWLEAAHPELRPQQSGNQGNSGVTVIVGMPGAPVRLPDITIQPALAPQKLAVASQRSMAGVGVSALEPGEITPLSPAQISARGETDSNH